MLRHLDLRVNLTHKQVFDMFVDRTFLDDVLLNCALQKNEVKVTLRLQGVKSGTLVQDPPSSPPGNLVQGTKRHEVSSSPTVSSPERVLLIPTL